MEAWYYHHMPKQQQAAYEALLRGLCALEREFPIPLLDAHALAEVFFLLRLDHPEIFWVTGYHCRQYRDATHLILIPEYLFEKGKIREHQKALLARVKKLCRPVIDKSEEEKELYIHDFICENVRYDKLKKPYSHEIIGPLGQGVGVCEGISKTVKLLADELGLWSVIALCGNNPEKGIKYRHTWNILRLGQSFYHLDATFDNSLSRRDEAGRVLETRYDYFNLNDQSLFRDHESLIAPAPACEDGGRFYYKEKRLSFTRPEEVQGRAQQAARKGRPLTFHWRGGYLTRAVLEELLQGIRQAGEERQKVARVSVNWAQAVLRLEYAPVQSPAAPELTLEEANEGEKT